MNRSSEVASRVLGKMSRDGRRTLVEKGEPRVVLLQPGLLVKSEHPTHRGPSKIGMRSEQGRRPKRKARR